MPPDICTLLTAPPNVSSAKAGAAVREQQALVAQVVGLPHRAVGAELEREAGDQQVASGRRSRSTRSMSEPVKRADAGPLDDQVRPGRQSMAARTAVAGQVHYTQADAVDRSASTKRPERWLTSAAPRASASSVNSSSAVCAGSMAPW